MIGIPQSEGLRAGSEAISGVDDVEFTLNLIGQGAVTTDGQDYGPGDYTIAQAGTRHGTIVSAPGGLVLLHWNSAAPLGAGLAP